MPVTCLTCLKEAGRMFICHSRSWPRQHISSGLAKMSVSHKVRGCRCTRSHVSPGCKTTSWFHGACLRGSCLGSRGWEEAPR